MRMPAKTRRQQILRVAARLFSQHGFDATTTREIAQSAAVNEAIIFRHFTSKDELYWAVVSEQISKRRYTQRLRRHLRSPQEPMQALSGLAEILLFKRQGDVAFSRLLLFSALREGDLADKSFRDPINEWLNLLAEYLREAVERGQLRNIDPIIGARAFVGMVAGQNLIHELVVGGEHQNYDSRQLGQELAEMWLDGVSAQQSTSAPSLLANRSGRSEPGMSGNRCKPANKVVGIAPKVRHQTVTA